MEGWIGAWRKGIKEGEKGRKGELFVILSIITSKLKKITPDFLSEKFKLEKSGMVFLVLKRKTKKSPS